MWLGLGFSFIVGSQTRARQTDLQSHAPWDLTLIIPRLVITRVPEPKEVFGSQLIVSMQTLRSLPTYQFRVRSVLLISLTTSQSYSHSTAGLLWPITIIKNNHNYITFGVIVIRNTPTTHWWYLYEDLIRNIEIGIFITECLLLCLCV